MTNGVYCITNNIRDELQDIRDEILALPGKVTNAIQLKVSKTVEELVLLPEKLVSELKSIASRKQMEFQNKINEVLPKSKE